MFQVKTMTPKDFSFAVQLTNTMNWNMTAEDFKFSMALEPEGCFTLFDGAERLGLITCISFGGVGWFGNLIVKPEIRRKGAGKVLVQHTMDYLHKSGAKNVGIYAYPNLQGFYSGFGFKPDTEFSVMHNDRVECSSNAEVFRANMQDLPLLNSFDCRFFGANRIKLLESILRKPENMVFYIKDKEGIAGFDSAKVYGESAELGPLVCKPNCLDVAEKLVLATLNKLSGSEVSLYLPTKQRGVYEMLIGLGFVDDFRLIRMFCGAPKNPGALYIAESLERG
jgi:N-acetylglutamate synthase-like GNAT family acetyltransferase